MTKLRAFSLRPLSSRTNLSIHAMQFPDANLIIALGGNGSGKTLFVRVLESLLCGRKEDITAWQNHFESAQIQWQVGHQSFVTKVDFGNGEKDIQELVPDAHDVFPEASAKKPGKEEGEEAPLLWHILKSPQVLQIFLVKDGNVAIELSASLLTDLEAVVALPLKKARDRERNRLQNLLDSSLGEGLLSQVRRELAAKEERLSKFIEMRKQIEIHIEKCRSLEQEIETLGQTLQNLCLKRDDLLCRKRLEERLGTLMNWLSEVTQERAAVDKLRSRHMELLSRFEENYRPFRGVPEDFGEELAEYVRLQERSHAISVQAESLQRERTETESLLIGAREKRKQSEQEREEEAAELRDNELRVAELKERRKALESVRRELEEKRELKWRLLHEAVGNSRISGPELRVKALSLMALQEKGRALLAEQEASEKKWLLLYGRERAQIQSTELGFPGFDDLPGDARELLHRLSTLRDELRDSERVITERQRLLAQAERRARPLVAAAGLFLALGAGFGLGHFLADWAVGLFLALLASGVFLIGFRNHLTFSPRKERKRKAELESLRSRWKRLLDAKDELERKLKPLLVFPTLSSGLKALKEYEVQKQILQRIREELVSCEAQAAAIPSRQAIEEEIAALYATLPETLQRYTAEPLLRHADACIALENELEQLEAPLKQFDSGGKKRLEIEELEKKLQELVARQAEGQERRERIQREIEERNRLENDLEDRLREDASEALLREKDELDERLKKIRRDLAVRMGTHAPGELWKQWQGVTELRAELRALRDELSAHSTLDELKSREQILKAELTSLQTDLSNAPAESSADLESVESEIERCQRDIAQARQEHDRLPVAVEERGFEAEDSAERLSAEAEQSRRRLAELEKERDDLEYALAQMDSELSHLKENLLHEILSAAGNLVSDLTEDRIQHLAWSLEEGLAVGSGKGSLTPAAYLSGGLRDLVMFGLRLAIVEKLEWLRPPLILDDPFSRLDPNHLSRVRELLGAFSRRHQVILLSRDPRYAAWGYTISLDEPRPLQANAAS